MSLTESIWILKDGRYRMNWCVGEQIPDDIGSAIDDLKDDVNSNKDIYSSALTRINNKTMCKRLSFEQIFDIKVLQYND